jgi:hypothetical protein
LITLSFEPRHRVLMAEVTGIFSSQDMAELDAAVILFLSRLGDASVRAVFDFSAVEAFAVPESKIAERALRPPIVRGQRVLVAPSSSNEGFAAQFRHLQRIAANNEPMIVGSVAEAFAALMLEQPSFEPVVEG